MKREPKASKWFGLGVVGLFLVTMSQVQAAAIIDFGPLPNSVPAGDDGSSDRVDIGFPVKFFGKDFNTLFVNNNGSVTLGGLEDASGGPLSTFTPFGLADTQIPIIAPFFADVDTRGGGSGVVQYGPVEVRLSDIFGGTSDVRAPAFVVNWINVGYYNQHDDKLNSFQLILVDGSLDNPDNSGDFAIVFNYDKIQWETGDASEGSNGLGGVSARAGFSSGSGNPGSFFELRGSGLNGALLDSNSTTGLIHNKVRRQPGIPLGRYEFLGVDGKIERADLAIAMTADPKPAVMDQDLQYTIFVKNFGRTATTATVKTTLPPEVALKTNPGGCSIVGRTISCGVGRLTKGQTNTLPIVVTPITTATIQNTVKVTGSFFDPNLENNKATASTNPSKCKGQTIRRSAPLSVTYVPTATDPAVKSLGVTIENVGARPIDIVSITALPGVPFTVTGIVPLLPVTIDSNATGSFAVVTERAAGQPPAEATAPYVLIGSRCAP